MGLLQFEGFASYSFRIAKDIVITDTVISRYRSTK